MSILKEEYLSLDAINEYLSSLINDEEQEIRVKAGELQYLLSAWKIENNIFIKLQRVN